MNQNTYNNRLKKDMLGYQSAVNVDAIWANIEPEVDAINARNNNRRGWYWLMGIGVVLLGTTLFLNPFSSNNSSDPDQSTAVLGTSDQEDTAENADDQLSIGNTLSAENNSAPALPEPTPATTPATESAATSVSVPTDRAEVHEVKTPVTKHPKKSADTNTQTKSTISVEKESDSSAKGVEDKAAKTTPQPPIADNNNPQTNKDPKATQATSPGLNREHILNEEFSMLSDKSILATPLNLRTIPTDDLADYTPNYGWSEKGLSYSVMFQAGIASTGRTLDGATDSSGNQLLQNRLNSETPLENIQIALLAGVHHHSGFNLMTGLQYTRITERFENTTTVMTTDSVPGIIRLVVNPNGDTTAIEGLVPVITTTTTRKKYYNRYNLIDIPFILGYEKEVNNLRLGLQAGVFANIGLSTEGRIFDEESLVVDIGAEQSNVFKASVGLSYYVGFSVGYEMASGITLHFAPYLHHYPGRFTEDSYQLEQTYSLLGVRAGVQYKF